ncbi:hypothetical protein AArcSt11_12170 [Natranaeroarchaeum aerophilus]|uniref:DUF8139 domain-containing protein n=1 Tax=Natranaeroarchaeum aerophilus TaxID=2917711 RepID=A0AAE3K5L8_9EURY|nr:hypothetical protein [Natranaeroarchaeum aerophilus]
MDVPDKTYPDYERFHGRCREVIEVLEDAASDLTGDERNDVLYRVKFDDETVIIGKRLGRC